MRGIKRLICVAMVLCLLNQWTAVSIRAVSIMDENAYEKIMKDTKWNMQGSYRVYSDENEILGTLQYQIGIVKRPEFKDNTMVLRMQMIPKDKKVKISKHTYAYGFSEYVSVKVDTRGSLHDYYPENVPNGDISGKRELEITSDSDSAEHIFSTIYDYQPNLVNLMKSNQYLANKSMQYCYVEYEDMTENERPVISFDTRFGVAGRNDALPWSVLVKKVFHESRKINVFYK